MIKYYKFNDIYFKLDDEMTFFEHVSNTAIDRTIIHSNHLGNVQKLHQVASTNTSWIEITQQEFDAVRAATIAALSV